MFKHSRSPRVNSFRPDLQTQILYEKMAKEAELREAKRAAKSKLNHAFVAGDIGTRNFKRVVERYKKEGVFIFTPYSPPQS